MRIYIPFTAGALLCIWCIGCQHAKRTGSTSAALPAKPVPRLNDPVLLSSEKIWSQAPHSAFTSLIRYKGSWYCSFREADAHYARNGRIRIIKSEDARQWTSVKTFSDSKYDFRDPKLCIAPAERLMISWLALPSDSMCTLPPSQTFVSSSKTGMKWRRSKAMNIHEFAWDILWYRDTAYTISYDTAYRPCFYKSRDGRHFSQVCRLNLPSISSEASLCLLPGGRIGTVVRCDRKNTNAFFGLASPPYANWQFSEMLLKMAGPKLFALDDGSLLSCGRDYYRGTPSTILARTNEKGQFIQALTLPSGGDNSYPGMVWHNNILWVSYYSTHEGKTGIYLAKIRF